MSSIPVLACSFGTTHLTLVSSLLGTEMRTLSNHTEPCHSSCRIWLATTPTIFDSTWPFCGPTAKYQHMLLSIALNANYMLSPRLYWQLMALEQSCPVTTLIDVRTVLLLLLLLFEYDFNFTTRLQRLIQLGTVLKLFWLGWGLWTLPLHKW